MSTALRLPDSVTIFEASALRLDLSAALKGDSGVSLMLDHLIEVDASAIQVLIWLQREGLRQHKPVALRQPSEALIGYLALTGLSGALTFVEEAP